MPTGMRPLRQTPQNEHAQNAVFHDSIKVYYDVQYWGFVRHLLQVKKDDFFISADPIFNWEFSMDLTKNSWGGRRKYYTNTRGALVKGDIGPKVSFATWFYENQAFFPYYMESFVRSKGELYYNPSLNSYYQVNAVIPGQGRTKPFKENGFDFANAGGYISVSPHERVNLQFGHDQHFIGHGYRSLLLSDNSFNYPYLKGEVKLGKRWWYSVTWMQLQELRRLPARTTPEALFYRKNASFYTLTFKPTLRWEISLIEAVQWRIMNREGTLPYNAWQLNPVMGAATPAFGLNARNNVMLGAQAAYWLTSNAQVYGQLMLDDAKNMRWGAQLGARWMNTADVKGLDTQLEYNYVAPYSYANETPLQSFTHYNLPMAHPIGASFHEGVLSVRYNHPNRVFGDATLVYYRSGFDTSRTQNVGADPIKAYASQTFSNTQMTNTLFLRTELGFRFNVKTNMQLLVGYLHRFQTYSLPWDAFSSNLFFFAFRTNLRNFYNDL